MKTIYFKIAVLVSFLFIMIPGDKLTLPIISMILVSLIQIIEYFPDSGYSFNFNYETFFVFCILLSFLMLFVRNKFLNLIALIIKYSFAIYLICYLKHFNDKLFLITTSIYLILSFTLLYFLFFKSEHKNELTL
jgi:hypothetical protein